VRLVNDTALRQNGHLLSGVKTPDFDFAVHSEGEKPGHDPDVCAEGQPPVGNWHFESLIPSFWPLIGSATSDAEHVL
jgi:hypothetical protein